MADKLKDIFDSFSTYCEIGYAKSNHKETDDHTERPTRATVVLSVGKKGWGFGEFAFVQDEKGQLFIDTECSNLETVIEAVTNWIKGGITDWDKDPERHKRYNEFMQRSCGEHCKLCHIKE